MLIAAAMSILGLLQACAPNVDMSTALPIISIESSQHAFPINDNTTRRSYDDPSYEQAVARANALLGEGHVLAVGYAQVLSTNFAHYGVTAADALEPCMNVYLGDRILTHFWLRARARYGNTRAALLHAISAYGSGDFDLGMDYARTVEQRAHKLGFLR